jgi:hypothetical protein
MINRKRRIERVTCDSLLRALDQEAESLPQTLAGREE